ncbi:hypothetical protein RM533_11175 [Croceicoccus sp. F390]|uniref:Uncharacterized protein n=1 Tax=Croceicoccus esteveae TaxID=3075597 RepID=A0ABU2ZMT0_9SPHN|nr:hypothetical protein [Croceicoccus sp. F390]MDT0576737.1 hypothetical protein [Croceicoccus sp. F390]
MRKFIFAGAVAAAALSLTACSEPVDETADATLVDPATVETVPADTMGTMDGMATDMETGVDGMVSDVDAAAAEAEADLQGETVTEAQVD